MSFYLFYSALDPTCKSAIEFIQNKGLGGDFKFLSVDKQANGKRPDYVRQYKINQVPAILDSNGGLYLDNDAIALLKSLVQPKPQQHASQNMFATQSTPTNGPLGQSPMMKSAAVGGRKPFTSNQNFSGLGHGKSILGKDFVADTSEKAQKKSSNVNLSYQDMISGLEIGASQGPPDAEIAKKWFATPTSDKK